MTHASREHAGPLATLLRIFGTTVLALAFLLAIRPQASAQQICMDHAEMSSLLDQRYEEARVASGLASNGRLLEIFASGDGATWTMVMTTPQGHSCIVASGEAWAGKAKRKPDQPV